MLGKSKYEVNTNFNRDQVLDCLQRWATENKLTTVLDEPTRKKFRFGSPFLSNPIYIDVFFEKSPFLVIGWVQTPIPFLTWKFVEPRQDPPATYVDYRKKGGLFVLILRNLLAQNLG